MGLMREPERPQRGCEPCSLPTAIGPLRTGGSSTGSGAAIGAYEWLDLAVGSDTGGSMRGPAGAQGIFGNRPSTGAVSMDHVIPLTPVPDTVGVFARSGSLWAATTKAWYQNFRSDYPSYPQNIYRSLAASEWNSGEITPPAAALIDGFVSALEGFLRVNSTVANYTQLWLETHGDAPANLADMLYLTYGVLITRDQWNLHGKPFFADYAAVHDGRQPFINPGPLARWTWGWTNAGDEAYQTAIRNKTIFQNWYETEGFGRPDPDSCSEGVYVYPWFISEPSYRNTYFNATTTPPLGFGDSSFSIMAGVPEVIVPLGEVPYNSTVSLKTEYLPVSVALRAARGCDLMLANLVADLEAAGILRPVSAGTRLYP
ncbi:uncharacterized protein Z518_08369 [Rhinocladiella mackenziei CBS 650.93]|uniref:Amidase domain-containing protein n=1 Tax=Rhinocladiella mackenziei CBS 650.93 TaxID=1442369 RepID=A0A0D2GW00_9EURO|nr:uncharacterized protein Z518_08369 [Rhinocladiella mackenziei CBS 650.93]KIX02428.1 hypothetical protein Z518_08369 [Rhinocladiella mackenziei CBS 650.93]